MAFIGLGPNCACENDWWGRSP